MKLLIADGVEANRHFLQRLLKDSGFTCIEAKNGSEAVEMVVQHEDLCAILMAVEMPEMSGLDATRIIKKTIKDIYLPVIFITSMDDDETLEQCFASGGDDYLSMPLNKTALICRLNAHRRLYSLTSNINQKNKELQFHQDMVEREHAVVEHVFANVINPAMAQLDFVRPYISPMTTFSGDLYLASINATGSTYIFLGDFTGHGLSAAIGCMPVSDIFYAMSSKCASIAEIAAEANRKLLHILPDNMFCCAVILELSTEQDFMRVWSGGMHDILIFDANNQLVQRIESQHMPLGVLAGNEFDSTTVEYALEKNTRMLMFTDGVIEAQDETGEQFGEDNLEASVTTSRLKPLDAVMDAFKLFKPDGEQQDDISMVEISINEDYQVPKNIVQKIPSRINAISLGEHKNGILPWRLTVQLNPSDFTNEGLTNHVLGHMLAGGLSREQQGNAFRVVAELIDTKLLNVKITNCTGAKLKVSGVNSETSHSNYSCESTCVKASSLKEFTSEFQLILTVTVEPEPLLAVDIMIGSCPLKSFCGQESDRGHSSVSFCEDKSELSLLNGMCKTLTVYNGGCGIKAEVKLNMTQ
ncbi:two-component system response regulator HsbR [Sessilibacter sp. MAH1]